MTDRAYLVNTFVRGTYKCTFPPGAFIRNAAGPKAEVIGEIDEGQVVKCTGKTFIDDQQIIYVETDKGGWIRLEKDGVNILTLVKASKKGSSLGSETSISEAMASPSRGAPVAQLQAAGATQSVTATSAVVASPPVAPAPALDLDPDPAYALEAHDEHDVLGNLRPPVRQAPPAAAAATAATATTANTSTTAGAGAGAKSDASKSTGTAEASHSPENKRGSIFSSLSAFSSEHAGQSVASALPAQTAAAAATPHVQAASVQVPVPMRTSVPQATAPVKLALAVAPVPVVGTSAWEARIAQLTDELSAAKLALQRSETNVQKDVESRLKQDWLVEKRQLLLEYHKEKEALVLENIQLKATMRNSDPNGQLSIMHDDCLRLQSDVAFLERDVMYARSEAQELQNALQGARAEMAAMQEQQAFKEMQWREREETYVQALEAVGRSRVHKQFEREAMLDSMGGSRGPRSPSPPLRTGKSQFNQSNLTAIAAAARASRGIAGRSPRRGKGSPARTGGASATAVTSPGTPGTPSEPLPITSLTISSPGGDPLVDKLMAAHVASPPTTALIQPPRVHIPYNESAFPNPLDPSASPSFVPKTISTAELNEEKGCKIRPTIMFTTADPNLIVSDPSFRKQDGRSDSPDRKELDKHRLKTLGHFSVFTSSAAGKLSGKPKGVYSPGASKGPFRFTGTTALGLGASGSFS